MVILLVGILSFVAAPRFFKHDDLAERRAADEMIVALRYAQQMAMSRGGGIRFVTTANSYTVSNTVGTPLPNPDRSGNYSVLLPSGVTATPVTIDFSELGAPTPNGASINLGSRTITIEAETGYAHY